MLRGQFDIQNADPQKNAKTWGVDAAGGTFSSGSDLSERDYLLLRVIWTRWRSIADFEQYMRNTPDLKDETGTPTPYTGYVTPENDELARQIYSELQPSFQGYLNDIQSNKDGTRPRPECQQYLSARYWQSLVKFKIKEVHTDVEAAALPSKVQKKVNPTSSADNDSSASSASSASSSGDDDDSADEITKSMVNTSISAPPQNSCETKRPRPVSDGHAGSAPILSGRRGHAESGHVRRDIR